MRTVLFLLGLSSAAAAQVTGTVEYQDRSYDGSGFIGFVNRPVRQAEIEIVRAGDNFVFGSGVTDDAGGFSVAGVPGGEVVRFRLYARRAGGKINLVVRNNPGANLMYSVASNTIDTSVTTSFGTVTLTLGGGAAPVFNIFDCGLKNFEYLASLEPSLPALPALLTLYWEAGTANGTYFERTVNAVFLLGMTSDPDEYDDDIILHEIGHWLAFNYSKDDTLGGSHSVVDQLDPRTSWSEGWAHYWSASVKRHENLRLSLLSLPPEYVSPNLQVDNFGISHSTFDVEGPSFPAQAIMATNELAVACVLWDISDAANEPAFDSLSGNELEIWKAFSVRIPSATEITLEDFHAGLALEAPGIMAAVTGDESSAGIFKDRLIRYYPDGSEPNNAPGGAPTLPLGPAGLTLRTTYAAGDEDWYTLDATPGTLVLETLNLGDGADTLLQLYDASGTTILASNDNRSPTDRSSQIAYLVFAPTSFRVRVLAAGAVVQHGYYDLRGQIVVNAPPTLVSVAASATSGSAPLRVTFTAAISDVDGGAHEFQWDFNGDGTFDWSSIEGSTVTTTYDEPGTFIALLRVLDSGDSVVTSPVTITVLPSTVPTITFQPTPPSGPAPFNVSFDATVSGVIPTAYLWDFEGNGSFDFASSTSAAAPFVFRSSGTFFPRLLVRDSQGRATRAIAPAVTVTAGASPPSVGTFTADSGFIPYFSTFNVGHSDLGPSGRVEFDVDGDGRYDYIVLPSSATGTTFAAEIQRVGTLTARVRVTDSAGRSATSTASFSARSLGVTGWLVDPRAGDRLSGTSVTLTAQAVPEGISKTVQFQRRDALGGPWVDIGGPIPSTGTLFATTWNVSGLPELSSHDLRILINGTISSGDTANTISIVSAAPTITENGPVRTKEIRTDRTTISRNAQGVWVAVPLGSTSSALPLRLEPVSPPMANGSALSMAPRGSGWRLGFDGTFTNTFQLRLPFSGDGTDLEIHHFDGASGVWQRLAFAQINHAGGWAEASVNESGTYALFEPAQARGGGGGTCGLTGLEGPLLLGLLYVRRRRR